MNSQGPLHGGPGPGPGHSGTAGPPAPPGPGFDRDRDLEERRRVLEQEEVASREREQLERQQQQSQQQPQREAYPSSGTPHHSSASALPIHQPVASRIPGAISPGGLLANHSSSTSHMLGAPPQGPVSFGAAIHSGDTNRPPQQASQNSTNPPHQIFAPIPHGSGPPSNTSSAPVGPGALFGGPLQQQDSGRPLQQVAPYAGAMAPINNVPAGPVSSAMGQGQQPILNDALSYLDQVKVQFSDHPDVYNRFLDIMKDFKSQTIDTPGVINRVSELFAGHPNLIQGFNTFLPPGYRIECGAGNDPNSIRVTTPQGTTVQSITGNRSAQQDSGNHRPTEAGPHGFGQRQRGHWPPGQPGIESPEATFSTPAQNGPGGAFGGSHGSGQGPPFDNTSPAHPHHQHPPQHHQSQQSQTHQQHGGQGQNQSQQIQQPQQQQPSQQAPNSNQRSGPVQPQPPAIGSAQPPTRNAHTPTPIGPGPNAPQGSGGPGSGERRAPVEFNHAINYVNKIKNRFHDKPEIYKQFLEILQTYQREQRPITDVHSQVTKLFREAPDLLDDFKQFLPETIPQNKLPGAHPIEEGAAVMAGLATTPQPSHLRDGQKMPPVGNFAPPSATKDNPKKRPRPDKQSAPAPAPTVVIDLPAVRTSTSVQPTKRPKLAHNKQGNTDSPIVEPTLVPTLPEPLPPLAFAEAHADELGFFDRAKKHINNRVAFTEFLKLCNLFAHRLIDRATLVNKAASFLGSNTELMSWFTSFVMSGEPAQIEIMNRPKPPVEKVSLSNCRGYGPSYRLLPRRERLKPCSGRDEMCNSVLNDQFASHPTWASEDSGFVAHRKNAFEEGLHRIEEERHDYDFNIEANQKCIALLEPIANQMLSMSPSEMHKFQMPSGLGGPNTSIYKRVFKKLYGERGIDVVNELFQSPFAVLPVVLARMKQKDEEWRFSQREWEKVWAQQTLSMHLKSLDHMGIHVKAVDKKQLTAKHLLDVIKTKHEEQRRARLTGKSVSRYQFVWKFEDTSLVLNFFRLLVVYITQSGQYNTIEKDRLIDFFQDFLHRLFNIPTLDLQDHIADIPRDDLEDDPDNEMAQELSNNSKSRRNGKKSDLRRGVLDPGRNGGKSRGQEDSVGSGSKETTPDVGSGNEEDMPDIPEEQSALDSSNERWLPIVPRPTVVEGENPLGPSDADLKADEMFFRKWHNLFCNQTIYLFFYYLHLIYSRLQKIKEDRESVLQEIRRSKAPKPANTIGIPHTRSVYFQDEDCSTFWPKTVGLIESFLNNETEEAVYQDILRHYYLQTGWAVYNIQDQFKTLCRHAMVCASGDTKDKTHDLLYQFLGGLQADETSYQHEINQRKFAEKCVKDGDMFAICWIPEKKEASCRYVLREESTFFPEEMQLREQWQYYISSYMGVEPTEGISRAKLHKVVLGRNLPGDVDSDDGILRKPVSFNEELVLRICLNSTKIVWEKGTSEFFVYRRQEGLSSADDHETGKESDRDDTKKENKSRNGSRKSPQKEAETKIAKVNSGVKKPLDAMEEKLIKNSSWMIGLSDEKVKRAKEAWRQFVDNGISPPEPPTPTPKSMLAVDVPMAPAAN